MISKENKRNTKGHNNPLTFCSLLEWLSFPDPGFFLLTVLNIVTQYGFSGSKVTEMVKWRRS